MLSREAYIEAISSADVWEGHVADHLDTATYFVLGCQGRVVCADGVTTMVAPTVPTNAIMWSIQAGWHGPAVQLADWCFPLLDYEANINAMLQLLAVLADIRQRRPVYFAFPDGEEPRLLAAVTVDGLSEEIVDLFRVDERLTKHDQLLLAMTVVPSSRCKMH